MLDAAKEANAEGFIYTSSCCVVVDCLGFPYHNIDEQWPIPAASLIYGESKVGISLKPVVLSYTRGPRDANDGHGTNPLGCGRGNGSPGIEQHDGHLFTPTIRPVRAW